MATRRKRSSSGELFSFPIIPNHDPDSDFEFEFGCFTRLDSPSLDPYETSPADHLFCNGRLLPHAFPSQPSATTITMASADHGSRGTSRTSSINSTNSRSSTCSSARTSPSDSSERRLLYYSRIWGCNNKASKVVTGQLYGDSHRWQYITAVPVLKREASRRKNGEAKKQGDHQEKSVSKGRSRACLRFFRLFLLACRECHAMEPSRKQRCGGNEI